MASEQIHHGAPIGMIRTNEILCDACSVVICHVREVPEDGWNHLHNLCSACFASRASHAEG